jgi:hypothetical protein
MDSNLNIGSKYYNLLVFLRFTSFLEDYTVYTNFVVNNIEDNHCFYILI